MCGYLYEAHLVLMVTEGGVVLLTFPKHGKKETKR